MAALQGVILLTTASGLLPYAPALAAVIAALALLTWSFARDIHWLFRTRPQQAPSAAETKPTHATSA